MSLVGPTGIDNIERLGNSHRVDHLVCTLWNQAQTDGEPFGDPSDPAAADAFVKWMRGPAPHGARHGVNRYLFSAYLTRPDLQMEFPDLDAGVGAGLVRWALGPGRSDLLTELIPTLSPPAVHVVGFLSETLGLGEAARLYVAGLHAAGIEVSTTGVVPDAAGPAGARPIRRDGSQDRHDLVAQTPPTVNLACVNADSLASVIAERGPGLLGGRPTIGQWGWETDVLPPGWANAAELVDEVWVYSNFVAQNLGRLLTVPVVVIPPPVVAPIPVGPAPIIDDDRFTFVCMLDLFSTLARKNPTGVIDAFTRAFAPQEGPRLIVKTLNGSHRPQGVDVLVQRTDGRSDITVYDGYLTSGEKGSLLSRADCVVSLHRSEGFGLAIAEAMALGTPVIATGYSGNMDFTTGENSWLVDWRLTQVGSDSEVYPAHGHWAEPDLDDAASLMRRVVCEPELAAARAARACRDISQRYAPKVAGEIARARLELLSDRPDRTSHTAGDRSLPRARAAVRSAARRLSDRRD